MLLHYVRESRTTRVCRHASQCLLSSRYSNALQSAASAEDAQLASVNRSLVHLRLGWPEKALYDAVALNEEIDPTEKALFREARALYELHKFEECLDRLRSLIKMFPDNSETETQVARVEVRLHECRTGEYKFRQMNKHAEAIPPLIDSATFSKRVEIRESPGKGRGLYTTEPILAGQIVLCEKAFAYSYCSDAGSQDSNHRVLMNWHTMRAFAGGQAALLTQVVQKLHHNPTFGQPFTQLYHGDYPAMKQGLVLDSVPVVDS